MSGTTFPNYPGQDQDRNQYGTQYGDNARNAPNQHSDYPPKTPQQQNNWQSNQNNQGNGGWQKKPWDGQKKQWDGQKKWNKPADDGDLTLYKPYAVTGNQDIPPDIRAKIIEISKRLEQLGYTARVGGMDGIEDDVEKAVGKKEVHLPWREFNNKQSAFTYNSERAFAIAKMFHPTFDGMKKGIQAFLAKNARMLLGNKMNSPALFLLCWTEDGVETIRDKTSRTGFTGHPIAIASSLGVPVFNLGRQDAEQRLNLYLEAVVNV